MHTNVLLGDRDLATNAPFRVGAVSWGAVLAGAAAAAALSLILLVLGSGLGLSAISPWADRGVSAGAITWSTILWLTFMALASSGLGGYIAGRLRARWPDIHLDEAYFRDTAHGFLAWAVATLATAALLASAVGAVLSAGTAAVGTVAAAGGTVLAGQAAAASTKSGEDRVPLYSLDALFRVAEPAPAAVQPVTTRASVRTAPASAPVPNGDVAAVKAETGRIFAHSLTSGMLSPEDSRYVAQLIAQRTGVSQQEAETRVTTAYATVQKSVQEAESKAKQLADEARKNGAYAALWLFVSLLVGAFAASLFGTWGGRQRDLT